MADLRNKVAAVDVQKIIKDGFENEQISAELHRRRISEIKREINRVKESV